VLGAIDGETDFGPPVRLFLLGDRGKRGLRGIGRWARRTGLVVGLKCNYLRLAARAPPPRARGAGELFPRRQLISVSEN